jgi:hypothetical protein
MVFGKAMVVAGLAAVFLGTSVSAAQARVWTAEPTPNPGADEDAFFAAARASPTTVWAVGRSVHGNVGIGGGYWRPVIARRNAHGWRLVHGATLPADTDLATLTGVASRSARDAWAVGVLLRTNHGGRQLAEHWNGSRWSLASSAPLGDDMQLEAITAVPGTKTYWAVGALGADAASAFFDGTSWRSVPIAPNHPHGSLHGVAAFGAGDVWAVGSPSNLELATQGRPFAEHWDGSAWSRVHLPGTFPRNDSPTLFAVTAVPGTHELWAVGSYDPRGAFREDTLLYHFDGTSWHRVASPNPRRFNGFFGVTASGPDSVWAFGSSANRGDPRPHALILHRTAKGWHIVPLTGAAAHGVLAAGAVTATRVVAVGGSTLNPLMGSTFAVSAPRIGSH